MNRCLILVGINLVVIATLYGLQYGLQWQPCLLCYPQRWCLIAITSMALCCCCAPKRWQPWILKAMLLLALTGLALAARHVWIQTLPASKAPACAPSWTYLWQHLPWYDSLAWMFKGSRDCHQVKHLWWGLSLPIWSMGLFMGQCIAIIYLHWSCRSNHR